MADNNLAELALKYLYTYYELVFLESKIKQGCTMYNPETLVVGSSHSLYGIDETCFKNSVINCSMHSQDIYYDYKCAKKIIESNPNYKRCFIVLGYYIPFQDLSKSTKYGYSMIQNVYYPVLNDSHNWNSPTPVSKLYEFMSDDELFAEIKKAAIDYLSNQVSFFGCLQKRSSYFDLGGQEWYEIESDDRAQYGFIRANEHGKIYKYTETFIENIEIIKRFLAFLGQYSVKPVFIVPPFTKWYLDGVTKNQRNAILDLLSNIEQEVDYVDFNEYDLFDDTDFCDTDHLNEKGAKKFSTILANEFKA